MAEGSLSHASKQREKTEELYEECGQDAKNQAMNSVSEEKIKIKRIFYLKA